MIKITQIIFAIVLLHVARSEEFSVDSLRKEIQVIATDVAGINTDNAKVFLKKHMNPAVVAQMEKNKDMDEVANSLATNVDVRNMLIKALKSIDFSKAVIDDKKKSITFPSDVVPDKKMMFLFIEGHWFIGK
jgi:hypothetical protein